ncbi:hypothetical protein IWZ03DRAFT_361658 [Phyllosticta citriasiana]|uniref:Uncharacterized protein n=1 Tax=Phyllosticta citriasiana TaxID=595635 RepID=A0ABR1KFE5_9PEZI
MCHRKSYLYSCAHHELQVRPCASKCWIARRPDVEEALLLAFSNGGSGSGGAQQQIEAGQMYILRDAAAASLSMSPSLPSQSMESASASVSSSSLLQQQRPHRRPSGDDRIGSSANRRSRINGGSNGASAAAASARARAPSTAAVVRRIGLCEDCEDVETRVDAVLKREKREKKERRKRRAFSVLGLDIDEVRKAREGAKARVRRLGRGATGLFRGRERGTGGGQ